MHRSIIHGIVLSFAVVVVGLAVVHAQTQKEPAKPAAKAAPAAKVTAAQQKAHAQWWGFSLMWLIPWGWPVIYANRREVRADLDARRQCIENALQVWRTDLAGETFHW